MPRAASATWSDITRSLGAFGETFAAHALEKRGYRILDRNVRLPSGEIDIVAREQNQLVFVEVKTRRGNTFALPEDAISDERMSHLEAAVDEYFDARGLATGEPYRIEIVAIELDRSGRVSRFEIIGDVGLR
ncbi:MAG TPA: YraN family protein [Chloroflexota bacterium]|nr:YraN family protein [Chloroflexota bacterium]